MTTPVPGEDVGALPTVLHAALDIVEEYLPDLQTCKETLCGWLQKVDFLLKLKSA